MAPTVDWVKCPICGEPDMRRHTDAAGNAMIFCTNHACASNGGDNYMALKMEAFHESLRKECKSMLKSFSQKLTDLADRF